MRAEIDPRRLRPSEALRILNSTPIGEVLDGRHLREHMDRAGYRIGDGRTIDLVRYGGWLCAERHVGEGGVPKLPNDGRMHHRENWDTHRDREQQRRREQSAAGRDIGEIPPVADPARRALTEASLRLYCETYLSATFNKPWSPDHLELIAAIEEAVQSGGQRAIAAPRGSGKSGLCEAGTMWGASKGTREFIVVLGATEGLAEAMLESIKTEWESNDLLAADFPEICFPIAALEGIVARTHGQLYKGQRTHIEWGAKQVVLPSIPGAKSGGVIIGAAGLTGSIRGMKIKRRDGRTVRPDLAIIDDPQTKESANSVSQNQMRESIISGDVLGLAGTNRKMAAIMPCTVIAPGDVADRMLDRKLHPEWRGIRQRMINAWPTNMELWEQYRELRQESLRNDGKGEQATEFYRANRAAMDAGATVSWEHRFDSDELSALQHAMNLFFRDERSFHAEFQNQPLPADDVVRSEQSPEDIMKRLNGAARGKVPLQATRLTAFVDVQKACLWWMVCAWGEDFTGAIIDYGTWPDQQTEYFTLRQVKRTLMRAKPGAGLEAAIYAGLDSLAEHLLGREWMREDGAAARVERMVVDANWSTETVYQWCRETHHAALLMPSHGRFVGASSVPFSEYKKRPGERVGTYWRIPSSQGRRALRHVIMDVNWWKSFVASRLATSTGDKGALTLFGRRPEAHRLLADHLTAERAVPTTAKGRTVNEWKPVAQGRDNHWLDCLVGCAVGASLQGASLRIGKGTGGSGFDGGGRREVKLSGIRRDSHG